MLLGMVLAVPGLFLAGMQRVAWQYRGLSRGDVLPAAALQLSDGTPLLTEDWRGKPTLLVLFRPGCQACAAEIQSLAEIASSLPRLRVVLLSIDAGIKEPGLPFPVCLDRSGEFLRKTRKLLVPMLYFIDPDGRVAYSRMGRLEKQRELNTLRELLAASTPVQ
jgi:peroxiredoxin